MLVVGSLVKTEWFDRHTPVDINFHQQPTTNFQQPITNSQKSSCSLSQWRLCVQSEHNRLIPDEAIHRPKYGPDPRTTRIVRASLLAIAVVLAGIFAIAFWLNPYDPDGRPRTMATHTQLGMPPCNFVILTGKPCPACGMTTSFALLVRGDISASMRANWTGTLIAVLWALTMVWAIAGVVAGRPLFIPNGKGELVLTIAVGIVLVLMLARWGLVLLS
jgi:hypothetical protein